MKWINLLFFVVLIQSTKFIEANVHNKNDESENAYVSSGKFPNICPDGGTELLKDIFDTLETSFFSLHSTLNGLNHRSSSTTLTSASKTLFAIIDPFTNITGSSSDVLSSLDNTLPITFASITGVVAGLKVETIATTVSGAISDLLTSLTEVIHIANDALEQELDNTKKLEASIISIATSVQVMINTLSVIAEATTKAIGSVSSEVQETVICLTLVLGTVLVIVQSVSSSVACVLSPMETVLSTLNTFLVTIDGTLQGIDGAINSITKSVTASISVVIGTISMSLKHLTSSYNSALDVIQSNTVTEIHNSLEPILNGLSGSIGNIGSSVTSAVASFTTSLSIVSSSASGLLSNVAQLSVVFKIVSKLSGSDHVIVTKLLSMLPRVFETIKITSDSLASGIGTDVSATITKFIGNVNEPLSGLLSFLDNVPTTSNVDGIRKFIPELAKGIQYVAVTVAEITTTISKASNDVRSPVLEGVLALHFILGLVLYVSQWVLILATSISMATTNTVSENLSQLTIITSDTFKSVSIITATISSSLSGSLSDIINSIAPSVKQLGATVTTKFQTISGVLANIVVNIDQLTSGSQIENSPTGIVNGTEGSVSQILSGLTGSLDSISLTLSSSLISFTDSLKKAASSHSVSLKVISNVLILIVKQITGVTATASQILSSVSEQLSSVFSSLSSIVSKLSVLGDVSVSVNVSISNLSTALRQLIDAINDYSGVLSVLDDPLKNVAKNVQVLISTFVAIIDAAGKSKVDIINNISDAISPLPYLVCTVIVVVQQVLGAAFATISVTIQKMTSTLQQLILAMSEILQGIVSITTKFTKLLSGTENDFAVLINEISSPVSKFNNLSSSSLSAISGVVANIKVSLGLARDEL